DHAADHGGRDALHHIGTRSVRPEDGYEADKDRSHRHHLRADALYRAGNYGLAPFVARPRLAVLPGEIEVEQHHDPGFGVETGESDQSDPHRDRHVVTEQPEEPERADERERHG